MSVAKLHEELKKIKQLVGKGKIHLWITPKAEGHLGARNPNDLVQITVDAFTKSAREIGHWSQPYLMGHYENPDVLFVGARIKPDEPYLFVVQGAVGESVNWLRLLSDAFTEANKQPPPK